MIQFIAGHVIHMQIQPSAPRDRVSGRLLPFMAHYLEMGDLR